MEKKELLSSPAYNKKGQAKQGRRAVHQPQPSVEEDIGSPEDLLDSPPATAGLKGDPLVPPRSRRTGGWANELSAKSKEERFQSPERILKHDSDDEIPLIPDMDEIQDEELQNQVARAPSVLAKKVASFSELDSDLSKKSVVSCLDNISLSLLTSRLLLEADVQEACVPWTWDLLFTQVSSDLRAQWEGDLTVKD